MISKLWYNPSARRRVAESMDRLGLIRSIVIVMLIACACGIGAMEVRAGDAPGWMHAAASAPVPAHDEKTNAVNLYSEDVTVVLPDGRIKTVERRVYKILRPDGGKKYGMAIAYFNASRKITGMKAWCIPTQGKDYEVKEKEAIDISLAGVESSELITDGKDRFLKIPAAEPGNVVGYEIETEEHPYILQDLWRFQDTIPVREARYTLQLAQGWEYKAVWINHAEMQPTSVGANQWQWVVTNVEAIGRESMMPPWQGVASQLVISLLPPGGSAKKGFQTWTEMGSWEADLNQGRREPSPEIKQKVAELTSSASTTLTKMQAIAAYIQKDIRYVAIELGIGGWQPHPARDIYAHRFGDCKDKATLLGAMLREAGVDSYYLSINTTRGAVTPATPPQMYLFNHEIIAIHLPEDLKDPSLKAIYVHPKLGKILIFDPTDEITPLGEVRGELQANYGLLVRPDGGDLIQVPQLPSSTSGTRRIGKLRLSADGMLSGEITEYQRGDSALYERMHLRSVGKDADRIKPIESQLSHSLGNFQITKASIGNLNVLDQPLMWSYSFVSGNYAKTAGNLLLVRPRVVGEISSDFLEKKEQRKYPVEFESPRLDTDTFEIELPAGYTVDDLPPPANVDYNFASYQSKTEMKGNTLVYTRSFEVKELSVPVDQLPQLKAMMRVIGGDERGTAVLKAKTN